MAVNGEGKQVLERIRRDGVTQVRVVFLDYNGIARARSVLAPTAGRLEGVLARGVNFSSPTLDFNSRDLFPPDAAFDLASSDVWARPDPATYVPAPGRSGTCLMLADLVDARGEPWAGCPRTALRRTIEHAAAAGLCFHAGCEPEGYLFRESEGAIAFTGVPQFATADGLDLEAGFMADLLAHLQSAGIEVEQWSEEYGPGQVEVNLRYGPALVAADALTVYRLAFRTLARRHGLLGTFMPKPFGDAAGSGMHIHLSAFPPDEPARNLFDDPDDRDLGLSSLGRYALAGLLAHGEALTALGASTVNSYKRFLPGSWAPTHIMYAYASRAAFIRIPERETPRRLELRCGDAAGNVYLYLTGILAAMLDGIERRLDPGPPIPGDVGSMAADAKRRGARPLPRTLDAALRALETDDVFREALGPLIVDEYIKVKRSEWEDFAGHVGPWDRDWYLRRH